MTGEQECMFSKGEVKLQAEQVAGQVDAFEAIAEAEADPVRSLSTPTTDHP